MELVYNSLFALVIPILYYLIRGILFRRTKINKNYIEKRARIASVIDTKVGIGDGLFEKRRYELNVEIEGRKMTVVHDFDLTDHLPKVDDIILVRLESEKTSSAQLVIRSPVKV